MSPLHLLDQTRTAGREIAGQPAESSSNIVKTGDQALNSGLEPNELGELFRRAGAGVEIPKDHGDGDGVLGLPPESPRRQPRCYWEERLEPIIHRDTFWGRAVLIRGERPSIESSTSTSGLSGPPGPFRPASSGSAQDRNTLYGRCTRNGRGIYTGGVVFIRTAWPFRLYIERHRVCSEISRTALRTPSMPSPP